MTIFRAEISDAESQFTYPENAVQMPDEFSVYAETRRDSSQKVPDLAQFARTAFPAKRPA